MKAAVWYGKKDIRVEERDIKNVRENEVKVRVAWAGICGSDLHEYTGGPHTIPSNEPDPVTGQTAPLTMGHEFAGVIEEIGNNVERFQKGDRVVINPTLTHGKKPEEYDAYDGFNFIGLGTDGGFAKFAVVPEAQVYALPEPLSLEEGALLEPTAVAVQAVKDAELQFGQTVAVFGAGPIGLLTIIAAKAAGARKIIAFDLSAARLNKAKSIGATYVVNSGEQDPVEAINELIPGGADVTLEVAGVEATFKQALQTTKPLGRVVIVSIFGEPIAFNPFDLTTSGVSLSASLAYRPTTFQTTIDLMAEGMLDPKEIITDRIALDRIIEDGFEALASDKSQAKILVKLSGEQ
ncbi:2,3-butanediol dehydrogenase [Lentibacillus jeotgali]|uniref:2,3-butanediol dehydrogenase n=1 Tax=Lentibacillus jeotgali TaxID=558169 RepID=UPI0002628F96|nr:2,3-butanediol dehydrogenase [Lentibacillus jeotgali]